jgi:hypothetical protein
MSNQESFLHKIATRWGLALALSGAAVGGVNHVRHESVFSDISTNHPVTKII